MYKASIVIAKGGTSFLGHKTTPQSWFLLPPKPSTDRSLSFSGLLQWRRPCRRRPPNPRTPTQRNRKSRTLLSIIQTLDSPPRTLNLSLILCLLRWSLLLLLPLPSHPLSDLLAPLLACRILPSRTLVTLLRRWSRTRGSSLLESRWVVLELYRPPSRRWGLACIPPHRARFRWCMARGRTGTWLFPRQVLLLLVWCLLLVGFLLQLEPFLFCSFYLWLVALISNSWCELLVVVWMRWSS